MALGSSISTFFRLLYDVTVREFQSQSSCLPLSSHVVNGQCQRCDLMPQPLQLLPLAILRPRCIVVLPHSLHRYKSLHRVGPGQIIQSYKHHLVFCMTCCRTGFCT